MSHISGGKPEAITTSRGRIKYNSCLIVIIGMTRRHDPPPQVTFVPRRNPPVARRRPAPTAEPDSC